MARRTTAVVIGGSVSGLMAARALSEHFDSVKIIERDVLPDGPEHRKGVPQSRQIHVVLPIGLNVMEELFPGFTDDLLNDGCPFFDEGRDLAMLTPAGWRVRTESDAKWLGFTRPLLESRLRERVRKLENVAIEQGAVVGLVASEDRTQVTGVAVKDREPVAADLVVDASGRGSQAPKWFEQLGYNAPQEVHVRPLMGYASQLIRVPDGLIPHNLQGVFAPPAAPDELRGGIVMAVEGGRHIVMAGGMMRDYPPSDREGFLEFLRQTPRARFVYEVASQSEPLTPVHTYTMPGNQRRLWEDLDRRPIGFIAVGDAVASFNPIYGQGMTLASLAARSLRDTLTECAGDIAEVTRRVPEALRANTELAFGQAASTDVMVDGVELVGFTPPSSDDFEYFARLEELATEDKSVHQALLHAVGWMDPDALLTDELRAKVEAWAVEGRTTPEADPMSPPKYEAETA